MTTSFPTPVIILAETSRRELHYLVEEDLVEGRSNDETEGYSDTPSWDVAFIDLTVQERTVLLRNVCPD